MHRRLLAVWPPPPSCSARAATTSGNAGSGDDEYVEAMADSMRARTSDLPFADDDIDCLAE